MAGNEISIADYLFRNIGKVELKHLGVVKEISAPSSGGEYTVVVDLETLELISTEDAGKKADIYINGSGVSLKQIGGSFAFNRLQRANLLEVFKSLNFLDFDNKLVLIDKEVKDFHEGRIEDGRNRPWSNFFSEDDFRILLKRLMLEFNPNKGLSKNPAKYILEAPSINIDVSNISVYTFDEYFDKYKTKFKVAIRRSWIGQDSNMEELRV